MAVIFPVLSHRLKQELPGGIHDSKLAFFGWFVLTWLGVNACEAMIGRTDFDKNSHPLLVPTIFPGMLSAGSGVTEVSQWVSYWSAETVKE